MKSFALVAMLILLPVALVPLATAGPDTFPVCKDKDYRAGAYAHVHIGVDCSDERYVEVCPPTQACFRLDAVLA